MKYFFILLFFLSCGKRDNLMQSGDFFVAVEKNEILCDSCALFNFSDNTLRIVFQANSGCPTGSFIYREIGQGSIPIPTTDGQEVVLTLVADEVISNTCLDDPMLIRIRKKNLMFYEIDLAYDKFLIRRRY